MNIKNEHKKFNDNNIYYNSSDILHSSELNFSKSNSSYSYSDCEEKKSPNTTSEKTLNDTENESCTNSHKNNKNGCLSENIFDKNYDCCNIILNKHNFIKEKKNKFLFLKKDKLLNNVNSNDYAYFNIVFDINKDISGNLFLSNQQNINNKLTNDITHKIDNTYDTDNSDDNTTDNTIDNTTDNTLDNTADNNTSDSNRNKKWILNGIYNNDLQMISDYLINGGLIYDKYNNNILNDALLCNYLIGNTIYILLCDLQLNISIFNLFENTDDIVTNKIKNIIYDIITEYKKYNCFNLNKQKILYDEKSYNFKYIHDLYNNNLHILYDKINEKFGYKQSDFLCINIKKIFDNMFFIYDKNDQVKRLEDLLLLIESYFISTKIVKLLFNQQFYEYTTKYITHMDNICSKSIVNYKKHNKNKYIFQELLLRESIIKNKCEKNIINGINMVLKKNVFIDINYIDLFDKSSLLNYIISNYNFPCVINRLFDYGFCLSYDDKCYLTDYDLIMISFEKQFFDVTIILLEKVTVETLNRKYCDTTIYFFILNNDNIDIEKKLKMFEILIKKNIDFTSFDSIKYIINFENSHLILDIIIKNKNILDNFTNNDILLSIKHNNSKILKILLDNGMDVNGKHNDNINNTKNENTNVPIFLSIDMINKNGCEYDKYLDVFLTILEHKPDIEAFNINNETPLLYVLKSRNPYIASILLDNGADPFAYDMDGINCLMYSVMYDYFDIVKRLIHVKKNDIYLVNVVNENNISVFYSLLCSSKPIQILLLLQSNPNINYNIIDNNGYNIIDNVMESSLCEKTKEELCKKLIDHIDIKKINELNNVPSIIRAINKNYTNIVIYMLCNLVIKKDLTISHGNLEKFINGKCDNLTINVNNSDQCNFHSLVVMYLKNTIYGEKKNINVNSKDNTINNETIYNKKSVNKHEKNNENNSIIDKKINNRIDNIIKKYQFKYAKDGNTRNDCCGNKKKTMNVLKNNFFFILIIIIKKIYYLKKNNYKKSNNVK